MDEFQKMQKLVFGKITKQVDEVITNDEKQSLTESELKNRIKEIIKTSLSEKKKSSKDELPPEDVETEETETTTDTIEPEEPTSSVDIDPGVKAVQDSLQKAYAGAKSLGDEKLVAQIGNTITMLVRTQVLSGNQALAENEETIFENADLETFERMEGLSNMQDLKVLQDKLRILTTEWLHEGFDKTDIKNYLVNYVEEI